MNVAHEGVYIVVNPHEGGGMQPERSTERANENGNQRCDRRRAVMVSPCRAQPAYPLAPCHLAPSPGGDRPGGPLRRFQERAEIFEFGDQSVLDGDPLTLALEVRDHSTIVIPHIAEPHGPLALAGERTIGERKPASAFDLTQGGHRPPSIDYSCDSECLPSAFSKNRMRTVPEVARYD
jgi:hypothetical protein